MGETQGAPPAEKGLGLLETTTPRMDGGLTVGDLRRGIPYVLLAALVGTLLMALIFSLGSEISLLNVVVWPS